MRVRSLRIAAYLVIAHYVLSVLPRVVLGHMTPYGQGRALGQLVWVALTVWALFRPSKWRWVIPLVYIIPALIQGVAGLLHVWNSPTAAEATIGGVLEFIILSSPLVAALALLGRAESRTAFRNRSSADPPTEMPRKRTPDTSPVPSGLVAMPSASLINFPASVECWSCKATLTVTEATRGRRIKCPGCGTRQTLPA